MTSAGQLHRHLPFAVALVLGLVVGLIILGYSHQWETALVWAAFLFFLTYLTFTASRLPRLSADLRDNAARTDEPAWFIFAVTFGTIVASLVCLFILLSEKKVDRNLVEVLLSLATVALGWFTIHTMAALHYAHLFWRPEDSSPTLKARRHRGLQFPKTDDPGVWDFLYFAFVIGMTAQTSDVQLESTAMRRFALPHGIVSFFFNAVLIVIAVSLATANWTSAG
jgi:uncharacterized membrane protein